MATRNSVGRRLLSEAELEFANPFDETVYSNILETFNAPTAVAAPVEQPVAPAPVPTIDEILIQGGGNPVVINDVIYQPIFDSTGQGETFEQGPLTQVVAYNPGETDPGQAYKTYTPDMQEAGTGQFQEVGNIGDILQTAAQDLAPLAAMALTAGGAGGALGGFLSGGALTGTAASALGNALISGTAGAISGQDPLQAALLAAGGTYAGSLFGGADAVSSSTLTDAQFIAADASQLAAQGLGAGQIEQVLQAGGVNTAVAAVAADAASSGMTVDQIAQDITLGNRSLFTEAISQAPVTPATVSVSPEGLQTVTATGSAAAPVATLSDIVAAIPAAVLPQAATPTVDLPALEPTGLMAPEKIEVTGTQQQTQPDNVLAAVAPAVVPSAPVNETIEVTGTAQPKQNIGVINAGTLYGPGMTGQQTAKYDEVLEKTGSKEEADKAASAVGQLTLKDLYTALQALGALSSSGLFGGGGGGTQRSFVAPTATVPVGNDDYYRAVQQYYNTYMPAAPRDVATPLQQWYQGKFGG